jgi:hypothetical protein
VKNIKVLQRVKEERNVLRVGTIRRRQAKWNSDLCRKNCLLKHVIEGETKVKIG